MSFQSEGGAGGHKSSGNLEEREAKLTPCRPLAPSKDYFALMQLLKLSPPRYPLPEPVPNLWGFRRRCRCREVGAAPLRFMREVFQQLTCQRLCGESPQSQEFITPCPDLQLLPEADKYCAECCSPTPGKYSCVPTETSEFPSTAYIYF